MYDLMLGGLAGIIVGGFVGIVLLVCCSARADRIEDEKYYHGSEKKEDE